MTKASAKSTAETKTENKVLTIVFDLEASKGHLKWKVSDLARLAKMNRPLVYYHFGKSKAEILDRCLEIVSEKYFALGSDRANSLKSDNLIDSLGATRKLYLQNPSLVLFYQKWRMKNSPLQKQLIEVERRYQKKLGAAFPELSSSEIVTLHGFFHGVVTAPFLTDQNFRAACGEIHAWIMIKVFAK